MEILEILINLDFKYYAKNRKVYNFVKIYNIGVLCIKIHQMMFLDYIKTSYIESLKKYNIETFSYFSYEYFSLVLKDKNEIVLNTIFNKIDDKENLVNFFFKIEFLLSDEEKSMLNILFHKENGKLDQIKNKIDNILKELYEMVDDFNNN